ncbi:MAG: MarR family winged helix-turn-helix transcriptional regulator [Myxococcota bacterium]
MSKADEEAGSAGEELEALLKKWERIAPGVDGSAMLVLGRVGMLAAHRERAYAEVLAPFDLGLIDVHTLQMLRLLEPGASASPSELARFPFTSRAGMTRALDRLEAKGLVERSAHESDRRRTLVTLTSEGEDVSDRFRTAELAFQNQALEGIPDRERRAFSRTLDKLIDNLSDFGAER